MNCLCPSGCWNRSHGWLFVYCALFSYIIIATGARITSAWSADPFWLQKSHLHLISWMVKLTGTLVHTTCADLGLVRRSKVDLPGPSVLAHISVRRDFCVNTLFGTPGGTRRVVVKLISMDQITILTLKADHICLSATWYSDEFDANNYYKIADTYRLHDGTIIVWLGVRYFLFGYSIGFQITIGQILVGSYFINKIQLREVTKKHLKIALFYSQPMTL